MTTLYLFLLVFWMLIATLLHASLPVLLVVAGLVTFAWVFAVALCQVAS